MTQKCLWQGVVKSCFLREILASPTFELEFGLVSEFTFDVKFELNCELESMLKFDFQFKLRL